MDLDSLKNWIEKKNFIDSETDKFIKMYIHCEHWYRYFYFNGNGTFYIMFLLFWSLEVFQGLPSSTLFNFILGFEWENSKLWVIMKNLAYAEALRGGAGSLRLIYV